MNHMFKEAFIMKKTISIVLTLVLLFGMTAFVVPASSGNTGDNPFIEPEGSPVDEVGVADWADLLENTTAVTVTTENGVTTVKLNACIETNETLIVTGNVVLDLNGYGIRYAGSAPGSVIKVAFKASLTLRDSAVTKPEYCIRIDDTYGTANAIYTSPGPMTVPVGNSLYNVTGGYLAGGGGNISIYGGGVYVDGALRMEGGTIVGNSAKNGGGVYVTGTFTMLGGAIVRNYASVSGGACMKSDSAFTMKGGTISDNRAAGTCGGVFVESNATFSMENGSISKNTASNCGGVFLAGKSTFIMTGGKICNNRSVGAGAGVYVAYKENVSNTFIVSGNPVITGNKMEGAENNVYLNNAAARITVTNALTEGASIGVTTKNNPDEGAPVVFTNGWSTAMSGANPGTYFTGDDTNYIVVRSGGEAALSTQDTSTVAAPTFSPEGGTFDSAQSVTISCESDDATVYYTTDGSYPTTDSTPYSGAITVSETTTIKAVAVLSGYADSNVSEATYEINIAPTAYAVTVTNGTADKETAAEGESVTIEANDAPSGQQFKEWTGVDGLTFIEGSAATATATFTMPANAVTVTATYEDTSDPDAEAASAVDSLIEAIGEVTYTDECKAKIDAARNAYDALTDAQKDMVDGYLALTAAEARYDELKAAAETPDEPDPENPTNPTDPPADEGLCKWCGKDHSVNFWQKIVGFFHSIFYFFAHLFGKK